MNADWQDISTAPHDGTAILAYPAGPPGYVARQDIAIIHWAGGDGGFWQTQSGYQISSRPTWWMPLPEPPVMSP